MAARYARGKKSQAIGDRSGFKVPYTSLKTTWDGLRVEPEDWEPKHPQLYPPKAYPDPQALRNPRPDKAETLTVYVGVPTVEASTLERPRMIGKVGTVTVVTS